MSCVRVVKQGRHFCGPREFRRVWDFKVLKCTDSFLLILNLRWPLLSSQGLDNGTANSLGLFSGALPP